jgi:hypothetical protein
MGGLGRHDRGRSALRERSVVPRTVTFRLSDELHDWLIFITGEARTKDRVPLDVSTVCREALDYLRQAGDWSIHRGRLMVRHNNEARRGPKGHGNP